MESINWESYKKGWSAKDLEDKTEINQENPYIKDTVEWKSWNRGYNLNIKSSFNNICESCGTNINNCIC